MARGVETRVVGLTGRAARITAFPVSGAVALTEAISSTTNQGIQLHVECFYLWDEARTVPGASLTGSTALS